MIIPPANVTGVLHLGHALTNSIQDVLCRYYRMTGRDVLWIPGLDHAGIATQDVVEKRLMKEQNKTRREMSRDEFLNEIWKWKELYGGNINNQLKILGSSVDWNREFFTLDEKRSKVVQDCVIKLFNDGLIYRDSRIVNWCCKLETTISDIETELKEISQPTKLSIPGYDRKVEFGVIHKFAYKLDDADELIIYTTRIETIFADTAIAIHPDDQRYTKYHNRHVISPFTGKHIPIILDEHIVDVKLGSGVVKISPGHDLNDFARAKIHNIDIINIFNDDGTMNDNVPEKYRGIHRYHARHIIIKDLLDMGLYRGKEPHKMTISLCSRSSDVIEPMIKPQWWIKMSSMANRAIDAVRNGKIEIKPKQQEIIWYNWLENINDWCISRQLIWGHRIPVYKIVESGEWIAAKNINEAKDLAFKQYNIKNAILEQEEDVLDTWFSSALLPLSALEWNQDCIPDNFDKHYPLSLMETGSDIIFFWVARMVMLCEYLSGDVPFRKIYLHSLVRDSFGH